MSTLTEGKHDADFIVSEAPATGSRQQVIVTVAANTTLKSGTVLSRLTATGKYVPYDNSGSDGSESAYGALYAALVNDTGAPVDMDGVVMNWSCELRKNGLEWAAGLVDADKEAAYKDLAARGVKILDENGSVSV
jgi:hypothetical protein